MGQRVDSFFLPPKKDSFLLHNDIFFFFHSSCKSETLSTLRFAQRAKSIQNKAVINEETENDVKLLREQIRQLKVQYTIKYLSYLFVIVLCSQCITLLCRLS